MEFFKIVDVRTSEKKVQEQLTLEKLEEFVEEIHLFLSDLEKGLDSLLSLKS